MKKEQYTRPDMSVLLPAENWTAALCPKEIIALPDEALDKVSGGASREERIQQRISFIEDLIANKDKRYMTNRQHFDEELALLRNQLYGSPVNSMCSQYIDPRFGPEPPDEPENVTGPDCVTYLLAEMCARY